MISRNILISFQSVDIIRPICQLLKSECDGLENFEALMALGNLATVNDSCRSRIMKETEFIHAIEGKYTVWKLQNFSVTQILREIKIGESKVSKSAILTHWFHVKSKGFTKILRSEVTLTLNSRKFCSRPHSAEISGFFTHLVFA